MNFLFAKLVSILTAIVAVLSFQSATISQAIPTPSTVPVVALEQVLDTPTPGVTSTPIKTPVPTPDIPALVEQVNEVVKAIASYTPEPIPSPIVIYITQTPQSTPQSTPEPTETPAPTPTPLPQPLTFSDLVVVHSEQYAGNLYRLHAYLSRNKYAIDDIFSVTMTCDSPTGTFNLSMSDFSTSNMYSSSEFYTSEHGVGEYTCTVKLFIRGESALYGTDMEPRLIDQKTVNFSVE